LNYRTGGDSRGRHPRNAPWRFAFCRARSKKRKPRDAANRRGSARAVDPHSLPFRKDRLGILAQLHGRSVEPRSDHRPLQGTAYRRRTKQAARVVREQAGELDHGNALNAPARPTSVRCRRQWCKVSFKSHAQKGAEQLHRSACQRYGDKLNHPPLFPFFPGGTPLPFPVFLFPRALGRHCLTLASTTRQRRSYDIFALSRIVLFLLASSICSPVTPVYARALAPSLVS